MSKIADIKLNRRSFVKGSLMLGAASPFVLSACSSGSKSGGGSSGGGGTLNWLTWSDHYSTDQLAKVAASTKITGRPKLFSDNADAFLQLKQTGPQFDQVSADALWVKKYMESGRIPVLVVHCSDLLQPGQGQDAADDVGITDRSPIQGPDRRREHPDRPDGDRRNRNRFQVSVRVDR